VIDLEGVPFIDLDGINVLKTAYKRNKSMQLLLKLDGQRYPNMMKSKFYQQLDESRLLIAEDTKLTDIQTRIQRALPTQIN